jgi:deoxyadenosine/deoxycytidine kinase
MTELEYKIYTEVFKTLNLDITATIYNKVDSDICISRIKKRNRQGEQITPDYIQILHDAHEAWLSVKFDTDNNVLTIDGNIDNLDIEKRQKQIENIISFVNSKI